MTGPPLAASHVSEAERQRIVAFAYALPAVWQADTTTHAERTQVVRFLIKDVTLTKLATTIRLDVRWQTHACSPVEVARPQRAYGIRRTAPEVVECVRQWAPHSTDLDIAQRLHHAGSRSGQGGAFSARKVEGMRDAYGITSGGPLGPVAVPQGQRGDGRSRAQAAAALLNVTVYTIADWCQTGKLDGLQGAPHGPWWGTLTPESLAALRKPRRPYKPRHKPPGPGHHEPPAGGHSLARDAGAAAGRSRHAARCPQGSRTGGGGGGRPACCWASRNKRKACRMIAWRLALRPTRVSSASS
jgi:hypothetical protein